MHFCIREVWGYQENCSDPLTSTQMESYWIINLSLWKSVSKLPAAKHCSFLLLRSKLYVSPKDVFKLIHSFLFKRTIVSCISKDRNTHKPIELFFLNSINIIQVTFQSNTGSTLDDLSRNSHHIAQGTLLNALWWPEWEGNPKREATYSNKNFKNFFYFWDIPCGSVVKTLCFQCRGHRFDSWLGK